MIIGFGMTEKIRDEDKPLLTLLPLVVHWINSGTDLTEKEIKTMARLHPKEFEYAKKNPIIELHKVAERYKDHKLYRDLITVVLSDRGMKWVEHNSGVCKRLNLENNR